LLVVLDRHDDQVLHEGLSLLQRLPDLKLSVGGIEKIVDIFHIDLHERDTNVPILLVLWGVEMLQNVVQSQRDKTLVFSLDGFEGAHRVGLSGSSLAVDKKRAIVAVDHVLDDGQAGRLEDLLLRGGLVEDAVVVELVNLVVLVMEGDSSPIQGLEGFLWKLVSHRSDPDVDFDLLFLFGLLLGRDLLEH
jgi:hypothetical protein